MKTALIALALWLSLTVSGAAQTYAPATVVPIDCSGTIAVAATSQTAIAAGKASHGWQISNLDTAEALWLNPTGAAAGIAAVGSHPLPAGTATTFAGAGTFRAIEGMGTGAAVNVVATTLGHKFSCFYW
jgi:hypothetical protein